MTNLNPIFTSSADALVLVSQYKKWANVSKFTIKSRIANMSITEINNVNNVACPFIDPENTIYKFRGEYLLTAEAFLDWVYEDNRSLFSEINRKGALQYLYELAGREDFPQEEIESDEDIYLAA